MPWAVRRRLLYIAGVLGFFSVVVLVPLGVILYRPPTCFDNIRNQGETDVDKGGPCLLLDDRYLQPYTILWARSFSVRQGEYNAVAYIQNPNRDAGVRRVGYRFALYDDQNVLVAEDEQATFIMPGAITPVFDGGINTGHRSVARALFTLTETPIWERMVNTTSDIAVSNKITADLATSPRISATVTNHGVNTVTNLTLVATVFDTSGNAFASSQTLVPSLAAGEDTTVVFTWPNPFTFTVGQIDILPLRSPSLAQ